MLMVPCKHWSHMSLKQFAAAQVTHTSGTPLHHSLVTSSQSLHTQGTIARVSIPCFIPESNAFLRPSRLREASGPLREQRTDPTPTAVREALTTSCCGEQRQGEAAAPTTSLPIGADTPPLPHRGKSPLLIGSARGHRAFLVGELGVSSAGEEAATR